MRGRAVFLAASFAFCCLHGWIASCFGQDSQGDQLYYHYYAPFAFTHGRYAFDIAAGGISGFNNPLIYLPFYFLVTHVPARVAGFALGWWEGLNFVLVFVIGLDTFRRDSWPWRLALAALGVAFTLVHPMYHLELGRTFADDWATVPFLGGLILMLRSTSAPRAAPLAAWGGALVGVASALKLTNAVFALALLIAFLLTSRSLRTGAVAAVSMASGFMLADGYWLYHQASLFGSPLYPFFNGFFRVPTFARLNWRDARWHSEGWAEVLRLPYTFVDSTNKVAEDRYRDSFWLAFFAGLGLYVLARFRVRSFERAAVDRGYQTLLISFPIIGFGVWALVFHYARYMYILTLVAPVALVVMVRMPWRHHALAVSLLAAAVASVAFTSEYLPVTFARLPWRQRWYDIEDPGLPPRATVVLGNGIGFIADRLPPDDRIVGLGTNFFFSGLAATGNTPTTLKAIHDAMWSTPDQVFHIALTSLPTVFDPSATYAAFGFEFDPQLCRSVRSNLGDLRICHLRSVRQGPPPATLPGLPPAP